MAKRQSTEGHAHFCLVKIEMEKDSKPYGAMTIVTVLNWHTHTHSRRLHDELYGAEHQAAAEKLSLQGTLLIDAYHIASNPSLSRSFFHSRGKNRPEGLVYFRR